MENMDQFLRDQFNDFEVKVDDRVWNNIEHVIASKGAVGFSSGMKGMLAKNMLVKVLSSLALMGAGAFGVYYLFFSNTDVVEEVALPETVKSVTKEYLIEEEVIKPKLIENISQEPEQIVSEDIPVANHVSQYNDAQKEQSVAPNEVEDAPFEQHVIEETADPLVPEVMDNYIAPEEEHENIDFTLSIESSVFEGYVPMEVEFYAQTNGEIASYLWDFGDGTATSDQLMVQHTFFESGEYKVGLTVVDKYANARTVYQLVQVKEQLKASSLNEIPNVFSPNGDGVNDIIKVEGKNINRFYAEVLDANGKVLFQWNSIDGFWDGRDMANNKLPKGIYRLMVTAVGEDDEKHIRKKTISLLD